MVQNRDDGKGGGMKIIRHSERARQRDEESHRWDCLRFLHCYAMFEMTKNREYA